MLRYTELPTGHLFGEMRFSKEKSDAPMPPFGVYCLVVWESPKVIELRGMNGAGLTRQAIREIIEFGAQRGVDLIKAKRAPGHRLPFGKQVGDHFEVCIREAAKRLRIPSADGSSGAPPIKEG